MSDHIIVGIILLKMLDSQTILNTCKFIINLHTETFMISFSKGECVCVCTLENLENLTNHLY